jgi:archaellum component FlaF (FlaF/FlaG flagellin family)
MPELAFIILIGLIVPMGYLFVSWVFRGMP